MSHVSPRPLSRHQFRIAIICALPREADAMILLFDSFFGKDSDQYGRAQGDKNHYTTGRIGSHDVVLTTLPNMGTNSAGISAASLRSSFSGISLALLVGICGGVPNASKPVAALGDVVISRSILQYDYGKQYHGRFLVTKTIEDSLGRPGRDIRSLIAQFQSEHHKQRLQSLATMHLEKLQTTAKRKNRKVNYQRPKMAKDFLFNADCTHRHRNACAVCDNMADPACEAAALSSCDDLGCDKSMSTRRQRSGECMAEIFIGRIGSGNTVMKSGTDRDRIAAEHDLTAFETEAAGAWDEFPCLVVKGISDYADSHKVDDWQDFAAATAACVAKSIINLYPVEDAVADAPTQRPGRSSRTISNSTFGNGCLVNQGDMREANE